MDKIFMKKRLLTLLLVALGMGAILLYKFCGDSCQYLKGSIWGIDLTYLGFFFMASIAALTLSTKNAFCFLALSFGIGGELFLIGYRVVNGRYCPFCLVFGLIVMLLFLLNFDNKRILLGMLSLLMGLLFFLFSFTGSVTPAYAEENLLTSFGSGSVEVRLFTDYFCEPCRAAEPEIESLLTTLMEKKAIRITLIDTPVHKLTILYAKYFLYILNGNQQSFANALKARAVLYEAARNNISTDAALAAFIIKKGLVYKQFDHAAVFASLDKIIRHDNITSTPSCVISGVGTKKHLVGGAAIIKGLKAVLDTTGEKGKLADPFNALPL